MKWKTRNCTYGREPYEKFIINKFAILPIRAGRKVRWLEPVSIQAYYWIDNFWGNKHIKYECFVDNEEKISE